MQTLDGLRYAAMIRLGAENLSKHRTIVNDLNVFPIPDGDTGDNMLMTIVSGCDAVSSSDGRIDAVAESASYGMLLGARGNSGVILSRIFSGMSKMLKGQAETDVSSFGLALECGVREAYGAVPVPVEGTILTVCRDAVEFANGKIDDDSTFESFFDDLTSELKNALDRTPEQLDVLRQAGVVDSGGAGFVYIADGMRTSLYGEVSANAEDESGTGPAQKGRPSGKDLDFSKFGPDSVLEFGYCTEFLLRLQNSKTDPDHFDLDALIRYLGGVGDSLVCFREGTIVKVHVHTRIPGDVLNHCQQFGEFLTVKIENMTIQHEETTIRNQYSAGPSFEGTGRPKAGHKRFGFAAVASGEGLRELFLSLGADAVVNGGQSMNPSAEDFLNAFREISADVIFVFPNNGNVVLTAKQAATLCGDADVRVIPTKTVGEGYCAMSMLDDSSDDPDLIEQGFCDVIGNVVTGFVAVASRDSSQDGVDIQKGQYLGFVGDRVFCAEPTPELAAESLAEGIRAGKYDVLLLLKGRETAEEDAESLKNRLEHAYPRTETILMNGGQPIHNYIMILQ
ncbi:MAG: DAK2 domain-containing protein [Clostridia bacterium]|nr:DAK2 domain-containing protein [Clostridia bacterium]